jgi:hypothetical protein
MSTQKSRAERVAEKISTRDGPISDELSEEEAIQFHQEASERIVDGENQDFWTLYRALDGVSQSDVREMVNTFADTSQSTVSRVIRQKEEKVFHDTDALTPIHGRFTEQGREIYPDEFVEAYNQTVAEAQADLFALEEIVAPTTETPEWAARRFPGLVGANQYVARRTGESKENIADDSHLNRLDSVNTERWK